MSKLHKILIGVFCGGVLLCGLGFGVAFMEFSELSYGGKQAVGNVDMKTENFDVAFEPGAGQYYVREWWGQGQADIQMDSKIPLNTVRYQVTYNSEQIAPSAYLDEEDREVVFAWRWVGHEEDVEFMLEVRDLVLQNLKEGKIVSFDRPGIEEVVILMNPGNEEDVKVVF